MWCTTNPVTVAVYAQLERDSANPAHPLNRFATGNKDTLHTEAVAQGIDLRSRLLDFHRNYYTAERMTLAVQGNQPLADLEKWVKETFLDINSSLGTLNRLQNAVMYCVVGHYH
jgi:insulysin